MATLKSGPLTLDIRVTAENSGDPEWFSYSVNFLCNSVPLLATASLHPYSRGTTPGSFLADEYIPDEKLYTKITRAIDQNTALSWECMDADFRVTILPFVDTEGLDYLWKAAVNVQRLADCEDRVLRETISKREKKRPDDEFFFLAQADSSIFIGQIARLHSGPSLVFAVTRRELEIFAKDLEKEWTDWLERSSC